MKTALAIFFISAVTICSVSSAFAVPRFPKSHPDTPSWISQVRRAETPKTPVTIPTPIPVARVATEPISYTELALPVNNLPQPTSNPASIQTPVHVMAENVEPINFQRSEPAWYDKVEKYEIGNSSITRDRKQFDFHVTYRPIMANGQPSPVPEPSSIIGLAAPMLGSLVYWRRRRTT